MSRYYIHPRSKLKPQLQLDNLHWSPGWLHCAGDKDGSGRWSTESSSITQFHGSKCSSVPVLTSREDMITPVHRRGGLRQPSTCLLTERSILVPAITVFLDPFDWLSPLWPSQLSFPLCAFPFCMSSPETSEFSWESVVCEETLWFCPSVWFSQRAKPLFLDVFLWVLYFILGKVWEPPSVAPQLWSGHRGSVCVAWLVVALCSRTEILWAEPVIRVMDWVSRAGPDVVTAGNSNTSSSSLQVGSAGLPGSELWVSLAGETLPRELERISFLQARTSSSRHCLWQLTPQSLHL